jgi:lipopolysaccharide/colanic/teichoic acid biosynthesis glycosyltransferase
MLKRTFDIVATSAGLVVLSPLFVVIGAAIRLFSPGPVIYKARRVGEGGRVFSMYKFRTMVVDADKKGPLVTAGDDRRVTPIGRFLRKTKLDELPTLWNVLIGQMSLVGPRPENPDSAAQYTGEQRRIWSVRPGVTSLATIRYRNEEALLSGATNLDARYFEIMQDKLRLELQYVEHHPLRLDILILLRTLRAIFDSRDHVA